MGRVQGKKVVLTAAGAGIGRASALLLAREGATVLATDIRGDLLDTLAAEAIAEKLDLTVRVVDVTKKEDVVALAKSVSKVDVLFNCAGYVHQGSIFKCSDEIFERSWNINVRSMFWMCQEVAPLLPDGGHIINMSSVCSSIKGAPERFAYGTTKAAVIGLTKSLAADLVTRQICVNAICPGTVETPSWQGRVDESQDPVQAKKDFIARQKMGRLGTAEEIANLVLYLSSNESAYTTGTVHIIDGGWSI